VGGEVSSRPEWGEREERELCVESLVDAIETFIAAAKNVDDYADAVRLHAARECLQDALMDALA